MAFMDQEHHDSNITRPQGYPQLLNRKSFLEGVDWFMPTTSAIYSIVHCAFLLYVVRTDVSPFSTHCSALIHSNDIYNEVRTIST